MSTLKSYARNTLRPLAKRKTETGFSMLEAVVVVGVLLALAVGGFIAYGSITQNAKIAAVKSAADSIHTAAIVSITDSDSETNPSDVLFSWNNSSTAVKVDIIDPATGQSAANPNSLPLDSDLCVVAYNAENPDIKALNGSCSANPGNGGDNDEDTSGVNYLPIDHNEAYQPNRFVDLMNLDLKLTANYNDSAKVTAIQAQKTAIVNSLDANEQFLYPYVFGTDFFKYEQFNATYVDALGDGNSVSQRQAAVDLQRAYYVTFMRAE